MICHEGICNNCSCRKPHCVECGMEFSFNNGLDIADWLPSQRVMWCCDCFHSPILCGSCCLWVHEYLLLHVIQVHLYLLSKLQFSVWQTILAGIHRHVLVQDDSVWLRSQHAAWPWPSTLTMLQPRSPLGYHHSGQLWHSQNQNLFLQMSRVFIYEQACSASPGWVVSCFVHWSWELHNVSCAQGISHAPPQWCLECSCVHPSPRAKNRQLMHWAYTGKLTDVLTSINIWHSTIYRIAMVLFG